MTSCDCIVFRSVCSFAESARCDMKTVADFVRARIASFCIEVFAGNTPFAMRCIMERGRSRSWEECG